LSKLILGLAGLNALAVFVLGVARFSWPSETFWTSHAGWVIAGLVTTALVPFLQAGLSERGAKRDRKRIEREREIETCLTSSLIYIVKHGGSSWLDAGVQAFAMQGRWGRQRQIRVAKVRLRPVGTSGVTWSKDKGVIGRCWATNAQQYEDLETHFSPFEDLDETAWDALPVETRFGLSFDDFQHLRGKYGVVAAVPIMNNKDRYIGCITADFGPRSSQPSTLKKTEILGSLASTADLVAVVLKH
jgi:hypothetical protein